MSAIEAALIAYFAMGALLWIISWFRGQSDGLVSTIGDLTLVSSLLHFVFLMTWPAWLLFWFVTKSRKDP